MLLCLFFFSFSFFPFFFVCLWVEEPSLLLNSSVWAWGVRSEGRRGMFGHCDDGGFLFGYLVSGEDENHVSSAV